MKELAKKPGALHLDRPTVTLQTLGENIANAEVKPEQIAQRLSEVKPPGERRIQSRWLRRYAATVTSANTGAVLADV